MINTIKWALLPLVFTSACLANRPDVLSKNNPASPPPETGILLPDSTFSLEDGDMCVNGQPRFLIGTILPEGVDQDAGIKTTGYSPDFAWLYETLPDYKNAQTIGLDMFGITPEHTWRRIFRPKPIPRRNMHALNRPLKSGLPIVAELAIRKGSHTWMTFMDGVNPKEQAWIEGKAHGTPYSVVTAEGLELWTTIWRTSAQYFRDMAVEPFAYRLFADVDAFDTSYAAKTAFITYLTGTFTNVSKLNQAIDEKFLSFNQAARFQNSTDYIGLHVLYTEFLEKAWIKALVRATNTLASVTGETSPAIFFQPHALENQGIDLFTAARPQAFLCAPAEQENPRLAALVLRAAACGKPLIICDVPVRNDAAHVRNTLLTQFARGYSLAFIGTWKRESRAWIRYTRETPLDGGRPRTVLDPVATELAGQQHAIKNPDHILNPYAVPTSTLGGIRIAKQDALAISDLFSNTNRSASVQVALLHARTSARLRGTTRYITPSNDIAACMTALADAGYKLDVIDEMQLETVTNTAYRVIVASDSSFATQTGTVTRLMQFVQSGGTLILTPHALTRNPYGMELTEQSFSPSSDWTQSELNRIQFHRKSLGAGKAIRLDSSATPQDLHQILDSLIVQADVPRTWECFDPTTGEPITGIEVAHAVTPTRTHGLILFNRTEQVCHVLFRLHGINTPSAFDPIREEKRAIQEGGFLIELKPQHGEITIVSEAD